MVKFGTCEQNWDFFQPKFETFITNVLCLSSILIMFNAVYSSDLLQMSCTDTNSLKSTRAEKNTKLYRVVFNRFAHYLTICSAIDPRYGTKLGILL